MLDYKKIGLKSGIEIHQQLYTRKLFCNCPSLLRQDEPDFTVERKLHVVAGESGEVDVAVEYEAGREREFVYEGYDTTCLVELDEEPPHPINEEALQIALQISLLLNCEILPFSQIMRKTVIDGSNTSGFQRTVLIARNGSIETEHGKVGIENVSLEEDACRIIGKKEGKAVFRLDRLGIPLVEIGTAPDIRSPEQAKEVALHIGEILRVCRVKRGIGTIRQDVNMSVRGWKRIEIKGVQEPRLIQKTIEIEAERQLKLGKKSKAEVRKAEADGSTKFLRPLPGAARMYPETDLPLLKISKKMIDKAKKSLPRMRHEIREELVKEGLTEELARLILQKDKLGEFKELVMVLKKPNLIAKMLILWRGEIARHKGKKVEEIEKRLNTDLFEDILLALKKKKIEENDVKRIMREVVGGKTLEKAMEKEEIAEDIGEEVVKLLKEKPGLSEKAYMGLLMQKYKGKVGGKELIELIRKYLK